MTTTRPDGQASQQWFDRTLLTDATRCPACGARLRGPRCHACGLPLGGPAGAEVWDVSRRAADLLVRRDALLATMRRAAGAPVPAPTPVRAPVPVPAPAPSPARTTEARPAPEPAAWQTPTLPAYPPQPGSVWPPAAPRASWPLQNLLLGLGALLLAGASIVFLAFTWGVMPLALRAIVIAVITAAVFGAATLARRKGLASSADAIAALGSLLVVLDAWALHATGLVQQPDGATFAALAALGSAGALVGLGAALRLDVARAAGWLLLPAAPLALAVDAPSASVGALLVVLAVVACGIQFSGACERRAAPVLRVLALVLLVLALLVTVVAFLVDGPLAAGSVLVVLSITCHGWSWFLRSPLVVWPAVAGSTQVLAGVCVVLALSGEVPSASSLWAAPLGALAGAASVVLVGRLVPRLAPSVPVAGWFVFFATTALPAQGLVVLTLATLFTAAPVSERSLLWASLAGLVVALSGSLLHTSVGRRTPRPTPVAPAWPVPVPSRPALQVAPWFAVLVLLGAGLLVTNLAALVAYWLVVSLGIVAVPGRLLPRGWAVALRASSFMGVGLAIVLSTVLAAGASAAVSGRHGGALLAASLLTLMLVLLVARSWVAAPAPARPAHRSRADLLLAALVVGAAGSGAALVAATGEADAAWPGASLPLVVLALGLLALVRRTHVDDADRVRVASRTITVADLQSVVVATAAVSAVTFLGTAGTGGGWLDAAPVEGDLPAWVAALALASAVLLALAGGLLALDGRRIFAPGLVVTAAAAAPVLAVLAALAVRPLVVGVAVEWEIIGLVVVAFFPILAATRVREVVRVRTAMEASSAVLTLLLLVLAAGRRPEDVLSVALAVAALATAAWACMPGRARVGWFALALGTVASWNALAAGEVATVEAYCAPVALAVIGAGAWNVRRALPAGRHQVLAGSVVLVVPTAFLAPTTSQWRSLVVLAALVLVAAAVLVVDEHRRARTTPTVTVGAAPERGSAPDLRTWFVVLALAIAVVAVAGRAVALAAAWSTRHGQGSAMSEAAALSMLSDPTAQPGVWVVLAALAVCGFSWLLGRAWRWQPTAGPRTWGASLTALVLTVPVWTLVVGGSLTAAGATSAVLCLVALWGAVALVGTPPGLPRVSSRTEFLQRAVPPLVGAYVVVLGLMHAADVPADLVWTFAGVFVAVVTVRAAVLERTVATWRTAAYGVVATLGPVTIALLGAPEGWRAALGVLTASGWLLAGLRLQWQAPVAIGGGALVLQVVVLAGPLGLAALTGVPGWVVLAVTGLVLLVLGLTYERQITTARATLRRYAELR